MHGRLLKFALLLAGIVVQVQPRTQHLVAGKWLERHLSFQDRWPAQVAPTTAPVCKGETFTVEELRREAIHYEALLEGPTKPTGTWRHLQLADLPLAQARFLQALGNRIGDMSNPDSLDVSGCRDVPCILNTVYGPGASVEGWAIYLWWLKMGNILNVANSIYVFTTTLPIQFSQPGNWNGATYNLSDYLFSKDELYAFWRLTHFLPTAFKSLTNLKMISRAPKGATLPGYNAGTCGLAAGVGYITLQDGCLQLGDFETVHSKDRGSFYHLVVHEMSHILDNFMSGRPERYEYYSSQDEWKNWGQWTIQESTTPAGTTRTWTTGLPATAFVTPYAKGAPVEHFAESSSFYRYNGDAAQTAGTADIYNKFKTTVYENDEFTSSGWLVYLRKQTIQLLAPEVLRATMECYESQALHPGPQLLSPLELPATLTDNKRRCLYEKREQLVARGLADLKLNSVDACSYLRRMDRERNLTRELKTWVTAQIGHHVQQVLEDEQYFQILGGFYETLTRGLVPVQMIVDCYGETDEGACYRRKITDYLATVVPQDHPKAPELQTDLTARFLQAFPFETLRADMIKTFQDYLSTQSTVLTEGASELWTRCADVAIDNSATPRAGRFSVGAGWMHSAQFNCINAGIDDSMDSTIAAMSFEGERVDSEQERRILRDLSVTTYLAEIRNHYSQAKATELTALQEARGSEEQLRSYLVGNLDWLQAFNSDIRTQCMARAVGVLPAEIRYHSRDEREALVAPVCASVGSSTELQAFRNSRPEFSLEFHVRTYLNDVERQSRAKMLECEAAHPYRGLISRVRNRGRRKDCFRNGWDAINQRLLANSQTQYNLTLPADTLARMQRDGADLRKRYQDELVGEILPDL